MDYLDSMPAATLIAVALAGLAAVNLVSALAIRAFLVIRFVRLIREQRSLRKQVARLQQSNCAAFDELEKQHERLLFLELRDHAEIDLRTYGGRNN